MNIKNNLTFFINRSNILEKLLIDNGFSPEYNYNKNASFSFYDILNNKQIESEYSVISRKITNNFDNKKIMYQNIIDSKYDYFLPKTFINIKKWNNLDTEKVFFLKNIYSSGGKNIHLINNIDDLKKINIGNKNQWIIQEDINNIILYQKKKITFRIYVVVTDKKEFFLYKEGIGVIHGSNYQKNSKDYNTQINHLNKDFIRLSELEYYPKIINQIRDIIFLSLKPFFINVNLTKSYHILGFDFLIQNKIIKGTTYKIVAKK